MSKFNRKNEGTKTTNLAGGVAYSHEPEMELIMACLATFLENKAYESGNKRLKRIQELTKLVDDQFIAKLAVTTREDFYLRSVSHVLVGELIKKHRGDDLVMRTIQRVAQRPDDLMEIVSYIGNPIPKGVKRGLRHALLKFSPYQLAKYRGEGKKVNLVDLFNVAHPNPKFASQEQQKAWADLLKGELKSEETWEARLSSGEDKKKVWRDMVLEDKIGYMALLRNLRNIAEQGDEETIDKACAMISNPDRVKKSKQLPFRFYNAYEQVDNRKMVAAISEALDHSLSNVPHFDGETLIAVDCSGSMSGDPIQKASIFAAALFKANNADVILYDHRVKEIKLIPGLPVLAIAQQIQGEADGGSTETALVFGYAGQRGKKYDRIVIISDNESWHERYYGSNVNEVYNAYRKVSGSDPFVYAIDIAGYGTKDVTGGKVRHLTGWSERMFDFMQWIEKENQLVEFINQKEI